MVVDWEQVDPAYEADITKLLNKMADATHADGRQLWLCVQPGQDLEYIDFENVSENVDRFVALLFDETSDTIRPVRSPRGNGLNRGSMRSSKMPIPNNGSSPSAATDTIGRVASTVPN